MVGLQDPYWSAVVQALKKFPRFMQPEDSLPCKQKAADGPYREPV
jgi:hypothetical protein